jgi:hypothetical protein
MLKVRFYPSVEKERQTLMVVGGPEQDNYKVSAYLPTWYIRNPNELVLMLNTIHQEHGWEWVVKLVQLLDRESF